MIKAKFQNLQDPNSRTFQVLSSTYLFSSIFKGLEVSIPNSRIFKDFSSTLRTLNKVTPTVLPQFSDGVELLHERKRPAKQFSETPQFCTESSELLRNVWNVAKLSRK